MNVYVDTSVVHVRDVVAIDAFLTHDAQLATAAAAVGFDVHRV